MNACWGPFSSFLDLFVVGCDLFPRHSQALICLVVLCTGVTLLVGAMHWGLLCWLCCGRWGCFVDCAMHWGLLCQVGCAAHLGLLCFLCVNCPGVCFVCLCYALGFALFACAMHWGLFSLVVLCSGV